MKPHPYFKKPKIGRPRASGAGPWTVPDLCAAYQWPTSAPGGSTIAIVELGGGWTSADMAAYFTSIGQPPPSIIDVSVDGTKNTPGGEADGEVALDIQVAAAAYYAATNRAATVRVYWAQDIAAGVRAATKDGCDVCSISWGADEAQWGADAAKDMEAAAQEALAAGMIVFAASGDNDSSDGGPTAANVDLPAGCPSIVGCGGTTKTRSSEAVWNDQPGSANGDGSGGGYSTIFAMPTRQSANGAPSGPGRMVPDVAANADPNTGYQIYYGGGPQVVGGTSAVAPLYAGLFASLGQKLGSASFLDKLWQSATCFADVTAGDNGQYHAQVGPDPCTGLGAPIGGKIDGAFASSAAAPAAAPGEGAPMSPTILTLAEAIAAAQSRIPSTFLTGSMARRLVAQGLTQGWPKGTS